MDTGVGLLTTSASLLEKQLALGVTAAQWLEHSLVNVNQLRAAESDGPMRRVRRDLHQAVDMFADAVSVAVGSISVRSESGGEPDERPTDAQGLVRGQDPAVERLAVLEVPGPLAPGQAGERVLSMSNAADSATPAFILESSDLIAASGARIPASSVRFEPESLSIGPRSERELVIGVRVPKDTPDGRYEGLLKGAPHGSRGMLLRVEVEN